MKIAICHRKGSFSDYWIDYCEEQNIPFIIVNPYKSDIIDQVKDCNILMWHFSHLNYKDALFAKQLLYSLEQAGIKVFPNFETSWHFDDKLGQKYMFEAVNAPFVPSYIFYEKAEALDWIKTTTYPKVFKLRGGAGATNVMLVKTKWQGIRLVNRAFGRGFPFYNAHSKFKDVLSSFRQGECSVVMLLKSLLKCVLTPHSMKYFHKECGYVYFQDFIPNNDTDTRIVVVGNKIIGERRGVRKNDFRASGSHILLPDISKVDIQCVKIAKQMSDILKLQVGVFDFVHRDSEPLLVEVSYGSDPDYTECEGYWDDNFKFHSASINFPKMIIEYFLNK